MTDPSGATAAKIAEVKGVLGTPFTVGVVPPGGRYGYQGKLVNMGTGPLEILVEFYDARGAPGAEWDPKSEGRFDPLGQFIARYQFRTLGGFCIGKHVGISHRGGLILDGYSPARKVGPAECAAVLEEARLYATQWVKEHSFTGYPKE